MSTTTWPCTQLLWRPGTNYFCLRHEVVLASNDVSILVNETWMCNAQTSSSGISGIWHTWQFLGWCMYIQHWDSDICPFRDSAWIQEFFKSCSQPKLMFPRYPKCLLYSKVSLWFETFYLVSGRGLASWGHLVSWSEQCVGSHGQRWLKEGTETQHYMVFDYRWNLPGCCRN